MNRTLAITAGTIIATASFGATAFALNSGDLSARSVGVSHARIAGFSGPQTVDATVRLSFPTSWARVSSPATRLALRAGDAGCRFSIVATTSVAEGPAGAAAYAAALAPGTGRYLLDEGTRGTSAWRVTRVQQPSRPVVLRAVGVTPLGGMTKLLMLPASASFFAVTTVDARSRTTDECHTGSYRNVVGPSIGDALATARGRVRIDGALG